jgi:hypothetical protein
LSAYLFQRRAALYGRLDACLRHKTRFFGAAAVTNRVLGHMVSRTGHFVTDKFPIGAMMEKGLTIKGGQTHVHKFMPALLQLIMDGKLNTTFLISHRLSLEEAPQGYKMFKEKQNEVTKVVLKPGAMGWTPPPSNGIDVPKWKCWSPLNENGSVRHEYYNRWY